jgi:hypothetical protein
MQAALLAALTGHAVDFVVVGGVAAQIHGAGGSPGVLDPSAVRGPVAGRPAAPRQDR